VDSFPADEQPAVRVALAEELRLIVAQRLVPTKTGGIRAVCEVLYVDEDVRRYIRNNELEKIKQHMER
jgi:twitching motility protein PilT